MKTATFRDLSLGRIQTTLVEYPLSGFFDDSDHYRSATMGNIWTYFFFSIVTFALFFACFDLCIQCKLRRRATAGGGKKDPLLEDNDEEE